MCSWRSNKLYLDYQRHQLLVMDNLLHNVPTFGAGLLQISRWVIHTTAFFIVCGSLTPQPFSSSVGHSHRSLFHCLWVTHATAFFIVCGSLTLQPFSLSVIGCSGSVDWKVSVSARKKKMDDGKFCKLSVSMMGKLSHREKEREKLIFLRTVYCRVTRICTPDLDLRPLDCDRLHADPVALIFDVTCLQ